MKMPNARIILNRDRATREDWLALHDQHLGASDAGAVMGLSQYQTPLSVYVTKKGLQPHKEENEYMRWGNLLETLIRREFVEDFREQEHKTIRVLERPYMWESKEYPFMCVDPDGFVEIDGQLGLLEIKTTTRASTKYWKDDQVPDQYYAQVQHGMKVLDLPFALVVCLMDKKLLWRTVPARKVFMSEMIKIEKRFWKDYYLAGQMPGPSGEDADTDLLLKLYPKAEDVTVDLGQSPEIEKYLELKKEIEIKKIEQELMKQKVIQLMGASHRAKAGEHKVTRVTFEKQVFNISLFRREHPRLAEKYTLSALMDFPRIS